MKRLALVLACAVTAIACGGPPPMQPATADVSAAEPDPPASPTYPLAEAMPADVLAFATMPGTRGLSDLVAQVVQGTDLLDLIGDEIAAATTLSGTAVTGFLRDLDRVAVGVTSERELVVALHASDDDAAERILSDETAFEDTGGDDTVRRFRFVADRPPFAKVELHWHRPAKRILVGSETALAESTRALADGRSLAAAPSFQKAARQFQPDPAINLYADLARLSAERRRPLPVDVLAPLVVSVTLSDAVRLDAATTIGGSNLPPPAGHAPPSPLELPSTLPRDTIAFLAYSSRVGGPPDDKHEVLLGALEAIDEDAARDLVLGGKALGVDVPKALNALGDEGVVGFVLPPVEKLRRADLFWDGALLMVKQRLRDPVAFATVVKQARDALAKSRKVTVEPTNDGFFARSKEDDVGTAVALRGDQLVVTFGDERGARQLLDSRGRALGDDEAYRRLASRFRGEEVGLWLDLERGLEALSRNMPDEANELMSLGRSSGDRPVGGLSFGWRPDGRGWHVHATMHDVATLGIVSGLMIYSVRRYLAASKAAEAKANVGAIARGARAAFERESVDDERHRLCASAEAVPSVVPAGQRYQPSTRPGEDFQNGDGDRGWPCLKFTLTQPHYYRYAYRQGSGYLGPARGGPDPGPNGFEASAEGDLDADGVTSLFTITGQVDPSTGELIVSNEMFIDAELE